MFVSTEPKEEHIVFQFVCGKPGDCKQNRLKNSENGHEPGLFSLTHQQMFD
jgi:hypothetical protein